MKVKVVEGYAENYTRRVCSFTKTYMRKFYIFDSRVSLDLTFSLNKLADSACHGKIYKHTPVMIGKVRGRFKECIDIYSYVDVIKHDTTGTEFALFYGINDIVSLLDTVALSELMAIAESLKEIMHEAQKLLDEYHTDCIKFFGLKGDM